MKNISYLLCLLFHLAKSPYNASQRARYWYSKYHDSQANHPRWQNTDTNDASTISRRLDYLDSVFEDEQDNVSQNVCLIDKWFSRQLRQKKSWLVNHADLNKWIDKLFIVKSQELWNKFVNQKTRLLNVVYTCVNNHIPFRSMQNYRKAVSLVFYLHLCISVCLHFCILFVVCM